MSHVITIAHEDGDEQLEIFVDGDSVGTFDHDNHGWSGMDAAVRLAEKIAKKLDLEVVYR